MSFIINGMHIIFLKQTIIWNEAQFIASDLTKNIRMNLIWNIGNVSCKSRMLRFLYFMYKWAYKVYLSNRWPTLFLLLYKFEKKKIHYMGHLLSPYHVPDEQLNRIRTVDLYGNSKFKNRLIFWENLPPKKKKEKQKISWLFEKGIH